MLVSAEACRLGPVQASGALDRSHLARFTLGNADLEREVLLLFAGQAPEYVAQLAAAETSKAWQDAAHTLKGSASAVGAVQVAQIAELAERLDPFVPDGTQGSQREEMVAAVRQAVEIACRVIGELWP